MKNRTKLWILMIISAVGSCFIFILLGFLTGVIWNKGYDLNKLNEISQETIATIKQLPAFDIYVIQPELDRIHSNHPEIRFELIDSNGTKIYDTSGDMQSYDVQQLANRFLSMPENLWSENEPINLTYAVSIDNQTYYLLMGLSSEAMKQGQIYFFIRTYDILLVLLLPLLFTFIVPYLLSIWFFSSMNRRISKLNRALNQVNIQSNVIVLEDNSKDEIGQLTEHYNSMAKRLQSQVVEIEQFENKRNQFLSNLSHDLRTPLTMILGYAETIRTGLYKDEKELQSSAKIILQRSRYIDRLLDQLLDVTKQDSDSFTPNFNLQNISEILRKIIADYLLYIDGQDYTLDVNISDSDIEADIDVALIERVIRNLLDNAIRYGKDGGFIGIGLRESQDEVILTVIDKGHGIPLEERHRIFERFYRGSQGRQGEGLGIGLAIVKEIIELHNGNVHVTSHPNEYTIFLVTLPKKQLIKVNQ